MSDMKCPVCGHVSQGESELHQCTPNPTPQQPLDDCTKAKLGLFDPAKPVPGQQKQSPTPQQPGPREWFVLGPNPGQVGYAIFETPSALVGEFPVVERSALTLCEERLAHFQSLHREFVEKLTACEAKLAEAERDRDKEAATVDYLGQQLQAERQKTLIAEEDVRFYRNEFENACERVMYREEERDSLKAEVELYKTKEKNLIENWGEANAEVARLKAIPFRSDDDLRKERDRYRQLLVDIEEGKYTYYEHDHQPDGTFTPSYHDKIREVLAGEGGGDGT